MITREKELAPHVEAVAEDHGQAVQVNVEENKEEAQKLVICGPTLADPTSLKGKKLVFPEGTKSLLSKYCTQEVWLANKKLKDKFGFSFKQAVFSGCKNTDSSIGVYAGSHDSYTTFGSLFNPII